MNSKIRDMKGRPDDSALVVKDKDTEGFMEIVNREGAPTKKEAKEILQEMFKAWKRPAMG